MKSGKKTAVVICITAPYPVCSGTRLRSYSVIHSLQELGYKVTVIYPRETPRSENKIASSLGVERAVSLPRVERGLNRLCALTDRLKGRTPHTYTKIRLGIRAIFALVMLSRNGRYDVAVTEYSTATSVRNFVRARLHILDTCDLMSVHLRKLEISTDALSSYRRGANTDFVKLSFPDSHSFPLAGQELVDFGRYAGVIAISESERDEIMRRTTDLPCSYILPCVAAPPIPNQVYIGSPVFAFSNNIFNIQGLLHFIELVLPLVILEEPDFRLVVTGDPPQEAKNCKYIVCTGFLERIEDGYLGSGFAIIPTFAGTGQQLKVAEAMSYGLSVIGYKKRIDQGVITDGVEGFVAANEHEFASAVIRLWRDRELAATMGRKARVKVERFLSQKSFTHSLGAFIGELTDAGSKSLPRSSREIN